MASMTASCVIWDTSTNVSTTTTMVSKAIWDVSTTSSSSPKFWLMPCEGVGVGVTESCQSKSSWLASLAKSSLGSWVCEMRVQHACLHVWRETLLHRLWNVAPLGAAHPWTPVTCPNCICCWRCQQRHPPPHNNEHPLHGDCVLADALRNVCNTLWQYSLQHIKVRTCTHLAPVVGPSRLATSTNLNIVMLVTLGKDVKSEASCYKRECVKLPGLARTYLMSNSSRCCSHCA